MSYGYKLQRCAKLAAAPPPRKATGQLYRPPPLNATPTAQALPPPAAPCLVPPQWAPAPAGPQACRAHGCRPQCAASGAPPTLQAQCRWQGISMQLAQMMRVHPASVAASQEAPALHPGWRKCRPEPLKHSALQACSLPTCVLCERVQRRPRRYRGLHGPEATLNQVCMVVQDPARSLPARLQENDKGTVRTEVWRCQRGGFGRAGPSVPPGRRSAGSERSVSCRRCLGRTHAIYAEQTVNGTAVCTSLGPTASHPRRPAGQACTVDWIPLCTPPLYK